jgi:hypothetical protein
LGSSFDQSFTAGTLVAGVKVVKVMAISGLSVVRDALN